MVERLGGRIWVLVALAAMCAVEVVALRSDRYGIYLIGAACVVALFVIGLRADLRRLALGATYACAFTLTWNGWFVGPVRPGDVLILLAAGLLFLANPNDAFRTPPWWIKQLAIAILAVAVLTILFPPDATYLANRTVLNAAGQATVDTKSSLAAANLGVAAKFIVAVLVTPLAFIGAARLGRSVLRRLAILFAAGAAASGWAATADHFGANVGRIVTGIPNIASRQIGFSDHPNFLAAGVVLAIPVAWWLIVEGRGLERLLGLAILPGLLGGVYASGSRGGAVCAVLVVAASVALHPRSRQYLPLIAMAGVTAVVAVIGLFPHVEHQILSVTRLASGSSGTQGSDAVRAIVGAQGVHDFQFSPFHGVGLQASFDASQVYLQELASGGLLLFVAMQIYTGGAIVTAWRLRQRSQLAVALLVSLIGIVALNFFEANLTDRFYYLPTALLAALVYTLDARKEPATDLMSHVEPARVLVPAPA